MRPRARDCNTHVFLLAAPIGFVAVIPDFELRERLADCFQLAGIVAVQLAGGPFIAFTPGQFSSA